MIYVVTVLAARLQEFVKIVSIRACGTSLCQGILRFLRRLSLPAELANEKIEIPIETHLRQNCLTWGSFVRRPLAFEKGVLDNAAEIMRLRAERLERQAAQASKLKFASWVDEAMGSPKVAHRWCRRNDSEEELLA